MKVNAGGHQSPFQQKECTTVLKRGEEATFYAGCNLFWQDHTWMANHRMPINKAQVEQIMKAQLKIDDPPQRFPFTVTVALDNADMDVSTHIGALKRVSPPEPVHALLFALAKAITSKQPVGILQRWKALALTTEFAFQVVPQGGDDRYWKCQELRQRAIEQGDNAKVTTRQWIYDIMGFKMDKQAETKREIGANAIHQAYKNCKFWARTSEEITVSFVDTAITTFSRVFSLPAAKDAIVWCDETLSSLENPFQSIYVFQAIIDRAKTPEKIGWAVQGLVDHLRMGLIDKSVFANAKLRDHRSSGCRVVPLQFTLTHQLVGAWMGSAGWLGASALAAEVLLWPKQPSLVMCCSGCGCRGECWWRCGRSARNASKSCGEQNQKP